MSIQAIIFDRDGVLINPDPYWFQSEAGFAETLGKTWTKVDHQLTIGRASEDWASMMIEHLNLALSTQTVIDEICQRLLARYRQQLPVLPGALEAVRLVARRHGPPPGTSGCATSVPDGEPPPNAPAELPAAGHRP